MKSKDEKDDGVGDGDCVGNSGGDDECCVGR